MGTRATVVISSNHVQIVKLYSQFDGDFSGVGLDIARILAHVPLVNGMSGEGPCFNGMGCLAATLISKLKDRPGTWYLRKPEYPPEHYHYSISGEDMRPEKGILFQAYEGQELMFSGPPEAYAPWLEEYSNREE